jgi:GT2 family glycosyltransferase
MPQINASIVLYHNDQAQVKRAMQSFLDTSLEVKLYLVDNSSNDMLRYLADVDERVEYIFNSANLGYGCGHNIAIQKSLQEGAEYHLVLNPDVYFKSGVLEAIFEYMNLHEDTGNIMPQVRYPNKEIQYLCKLLPTPSDLIFRRFFWSKSYKTERNELYELRKSGYDTIMNVPSLSGCFMFLRASVLKEVGLFDENFFMYLEDTDLNRRIHEKYKTIFYPHVEIVHEYAKESYKNKKLLAYHIKSAIYYFNKWGWIFDSKRDKKNKETVFSIVNMESGAGTRI